MRFRFCCVIVGNIRFNVFSFVMVFLGCEFAVAFDFSHSAVLPVSFRFLESCLLTDALFFLRAVLCQGRLRPLNRVSPSMLILRRTRRQPLQPHQLTLRRTKKRPRAVCAKSPALVSASASGSTTCALPRISCSSS